MIKGRPLSDGLSAGEMLVGEERAAEGLVATAAAAVFPFHLDEPVLAAESLVELRTVRCCLRRAKLEVALVGVFVAACVEPGVEVRIGDSFFGLVGDHVGHAVGSANSGSWAVGAGGLRFAAIRALVHVADE